MRAAVIGAGSIGLLLAARLADAGADIALVCRTEEQKAIIAAEGIRIRSGDGPAASVRPAAVFRWGEAMEPPPDWALLAVKQTHWDAGLLDGLVRLAASGVRLAAFQNGLGHAEKLTEAGVPPEMLYLAVTTEGARREGPNLVAHTGRGRTWIGPVRRDGPTEALNPLLGLLAASGFEAEAETDIERRIWHKLLVNAAINPLAAVFGVRNGELVEIERCRRVMRAALLEALAVARAAGMAPEGDAWAEVLDVCRKTARNDASMLQDVRAGRETEIESITGALIREAARRGVPVPVNEALYRLVAAMTSPDT